MRPVQVSFSAGNFTAISKGLQPGDMVVTDGQDKLQSGTKIEIRGGAAPGQNNGESQSGDMQGQ
jgi:multidrug efflux pump subunit AcrA (membrane-fusion protein)